LQTAYPLGEQLLRLAQTHHTQALALYDPQFDIADLQAARALLDVLA
jgi:hypothetical protein